MNIPPLSDIELINRVKDENAEQTLRNQALTELTNRHSGIYVKIAHQYAGFSDKVDVNELKDDKQYNMYQWIIKYDADRNMKVGTFIGEMTKYLCLNYINKTPDKMSIEDTQEPSVAATFEVPTTEQEIETLEQRTNISSPEFWSIFRARHSGEKPKTWRTIGREMGMTYEWARQIYYRHIPKVQHKINT